MKAQTLHCQSCGAAVSSEAPVCEHCGARLATISCPSCFGMMFRDMKFCPHCGSPAAQWQSGDAHVPCPVCEADMLQGTVAQNQLYECSKCYGIWLDTVTFQRICRQAEREAAPLSTASLGQPYVTDLEPVRYRRCPVCQDLMNRVNFARCSGVVVDVCRQHGTWFDRNELQRILEFIRAGGLDRARERTKEEMAAEARRLEAMRQGAEPSETLGWGAPKKVDLLALVVNAAGGVLTDWKR